MFVGRKRREHKGNERLAAGGVVVAEGLLVPLVVLDRARTDVGDGEEGEGEAGEVPGQHGVPDPLHALTEVVGSRHVLKEAAARDLVAAALVLAETAQNRVRVPVDCHARHEEERADDETRVIQPRPASHDTRRQMVRGLDVAVQETEHDRHEEDLGGCVLPVSNPERVDEGSRD